MKTFKTSGTGSGQSLSEIESERIPVYQTVADAEADLANLEAGQIVMTPDEGAEELLSVKAQLKAIVADSTDFADFKTKIANW